jgi:hypothetical protein
MCSKKCIERRRVTIVGAAPREFVESEAYAVATAAG